MSTDGYFSKRCKATNKPPPPPPPPPPLPPENFFVSSVGDQTVSLEWDVSVGAATYSVYRGTGTTTAPLAKGLTAPRVTLTNLTNGTLYTFTVRAVNANGMSLASKTVTATPIVNPPVRPPKPTGFSATSVGDATATLIWGSTLRATSYTIFRGIDTSDPLVTVNTPTAVLTGLVNNTTYTLTVRAWNVSGYSDASDPIDITPVVSPPLKPAAITDLASPSVGSGTITLTWSDIATATSYRVYQGLTTGTLLATVTASDATITGLVNGNSYVLTVRAVNASGTMADVSNSVTATPVAPPPPPPPPPENLTVTGVDSGSVTLSWTASAGATSYLVYKGTGVGTYVKTVTTTSTTVSTNLTNGTTYRFTVIARNAEGDSAQSNEAFGTPLAPDPDAPLAPSGLVVTGFGDGTVNLDWADNDVVAPPPVNVPTVPALVQQKSGTAGATTTVSATLNTPATAGNLLVMVASLDKASGDISAPNWITVRKSSTPSVSVFVGYRKALGGETSMSLSWTTTSTVGSTVWIGEYSQDGTGDWAMDVETFNENVEPTQGFSKATNTTGAAKRSGLALAYLAVDSGQNIGLSGLTVTNSFTINRSIAYNSSVSEMIIASKSMAAGDTASTTFTWTADTDQATAGIIVFGRKFRTNTEPWTLAWISDIDIDDGVGGGGWRADADNAWNRVQALNPDLIVLGGDPTNDASPAQYTIARTNMQSEFHRLFAIPGNHDYDNLTGGGINQWWNTFGGGNTSYPVAYHGTSASAPWYSFNKNGWHVVCLAVNTNDLCPSFASGSTQYNWLSADLTANSGKPLLVIWHSPRYATDATHGDFSPETDALWALVQSHRATVILNGHTHIMHRYPPANNNGTTNINGPMQFINSGVDYRASGSVSDLLYDWRNETTADRAIMVLTLRDTGVDWVHYKVSDGSILHRGTVASYNSTVSTVVSDPVTYKVFQGIDTSVLLATVTPSQVNLSGLINDTLYTFTVRAENTAGLSNASSWVTATPTAGTQQPPVRVTDLSVTSEGDAVVNLDWSPSSGADFYDVYRGTEGGVFIKSVAVSNATLTELTNGNVYTFSVKARNEAGSSALSNMVQATPVSGSTAPAAPTGLTATSVSDGTVNLDWASSVPGASYNVYQGTGLQTLLATVTTTQAKITGLTNGVSYTFTVRAWVDISNKSAASGSETATPNGSGGNVDYVDPTSTTIPGPMSAYPNSENTGHLGVALVSVSGDYHTQASGEVITHKRFTSGRVYIDHPNVTMKFCQVDKWTYISGGLSGGVVCDNPTDAATFRMWNCTIGSSTPSPGCGVRAAGGQLRRLNVQNTTDGFWLFEGNVTLRDSWVHDLHHFASDPSQGDADSHNDHVQIKGGSQWKIYHNRFECWRVEDGQSIGAKNPSGPQTASQGFYATTSACSDMRWDDNIFRGPASKYISVTGYPARLDSGTGDYRPAISDAYITNNHFGSETAQADWTSTANCQGVVQITGNKTYSIDIETTPGDYIDPTSNTLPGPMSVYPDDGGGPSVGGMYGNTGVLGTDQAASLVTSTATTISGVVTGKRFTNKVTVSSANTIAKYCVFEKGIDNTQTGFKMWYCNIGTRTGRPARAMNLKNATLRRCNIMGYTDLMATSGNIDVQDCFMHDCWETYDDYFTEPGPLNTHSDVNQTSLGDSYTFKHNRIYCWMFSEGIHAQAGDQMTSTSVPKSTVRDQTSGLAFFGASGKITNIIVDDCLIRGYASSYITAQGTTAKPYNVQYMTVKDCRFGPSTEMVSGKIPIATNSGVLNLTKTNNVQLTAAAWNTFDADNTSTYTPPPAPTKPTGLVVTSVGDGTVNLDWATAANAVSYNVYQGGVFIDSVVATQLSVTGLTNGVSYSFTVCSVNATDNSAVTASVTGIPTGPGANPPAAIIDLSVASVGSGTVSLNWSDIATATYYDIYRGTDTGVLLDTVTLSQVTLTGLTNGNTYTLRVKARNAAGESDFSNTVYATPESTVVNPPTTPQGLTVTATVSGTLFLNWTSVTGASSYKVYQNGSLTPLPTTYVDSQATISGLTNGTSYTFKVSAVNTGGESGLSAGASGTPKATTSLFAGHVPGRIYLGMWASDSNWSTYMSQMNNPTYDGVAGTSNKLGLARLFGKGREDEMMNANIMVHMSARPQTMGFAEDVPGWQAIANGNHDNAIVDWFAPLISITNSKSKPMVFTFHHEPTAEAYVYGNGQLAASYWVAAFLRIIDLIDTQYPNHRIIWAPNIEENRFRNPQTIRLAWFHPPELMNAIDYWTFDFYHIGFSRSTAVSRANEALLPYRINKILDFFERGIDPGNVGGTPLSHMNYTVGKDLVLGIGEHAGRPNFFENWENNTGGTSTTPDISTHTAAKWTRSSENYIFTHPTFFHTVAWFNETSGAEEERLVPLPLSSGPNAHSEDWTMQTGDTETMMHVWQEKMNSGITIKPA